jgi:SAM-dependent methyltransferase
MSWSGGYVSDIEYTAGFYAEQGPVYLNFVAALNGFALPSPQRPFTYFELGSGRGMTINLLAAANPNGRFYAADFNPAHVAGAVELAEGAQLENLTLLEQSFEALAGGSVDLPCFDYITLHGIYTWVDAANQQHIIDFIGRYLKSGGIVYVSYNALPGWTASLPLQRLLVEYGHAYPNRSDVQVANAAQLVQKMVDAKVGYFTSGGSALAARVDGLKRHNRNYLVHEYMHKHWQPMYHADVARDLAEAKLEFVGSADLSMRYPRIYLNEEKMALLEAFPETAMQETLKDYCLNTSFRKDVFIRGSRRLAMAKRLELLKEFGLALLVPRENVQLTMQLPQGEATARPEVALPMLDALANGPRTLRQIMALPELTTCAAEDVVQLVSLFVVSQQAALFHSTALAQDASAVNRMNREIAGATRYGDEFQAIGSALTGSAIHLAYVSRLVFFLIFERGLALEKDVLAAAIWQIMRTSGRQMIRDGKVLLGDDANLVELSEVVASILAKQVPLWRQLRMLAGPEQSAH